MTSILKGLAALIAVVTVNWGVGHVGVVNKPIHHSVTASKAAPDTTFDSVGTDSDLMRAHPDWFLADPDLRCVAAANAGPLGPDPVDVVDTAGATPARLGIAARFERRGARGLKQ